MGRAKRRDLEVDAAGLVDQGKLILIVGNAAREAAEFGMLLPAAAVESKIGAGRGDPADGLMTQERVVQPLADQIAERLNVAAHAVVEQGGINDLIQRRRFGDALAGVVDGAEAIVNVA